MAVGSVRRDANLGNVQPVPSSERRRREEKSWRTVSTDSKSVVALLHRVIGRRWPQPSSPFAKPARHQEPESLSKKSRFCASGFWAKTGIGR
jgi:hypothetical protein